jgi:hypothetical protein
MNAPTAKQKHVTPHTSQRSRLAFRHDRSVSIDVLGTLDEILRLIPETTKVFVVVGSSPIEKRWLEEMRKLFQPLTSRVEITYSNELSLEDILKQVAVLPPRAIIVYAQMLVDAAGVVHEGGRAIGRIHAVANAPIFSEQDTFFGRGIVGGRMTNISDVSRQTAAVAVPGGQLAGSCVSCHRRNRFPPDLRDTG